MGAWQVWMSKITPEMTLFQKPYSEPTNNALLTFKIGIGLENQGLSTAPTLMAICGV